MANNTTSRMKLPRDTKGRFIKGYNYYPEGCFQKGTKLPEKTILKMLGRIPWNKGRKCPELSGENNGFYGKKHTPEVLEINRKAHLGKKPNANQLRALAKFRTDKKGKPAPWAKNLPQTFKKGELHPHWTGGSKSWRGSDWKQTRAKVIQRDIFQCIDCGSKKNLEIHHIIPYRITKDNSLHNLETLCKKCHAKKDHFYIIYGCTKIKEGRDFIVIKGKTFYLDFAKNLFTLKKEILKQLEITS